MTSPSKLDKIDAATLWLGTHWFEAKRPLVPLLRREFNLTSLEAIQVMRAASAMQNRGGAHADAP